MNWKCCYQLELELIRNSSRGGLNMCYVGNEHFSCLLLLGLSLLQGEVLWTLETPVVELWEKPSLHTNW